MLRFEFTEQMTNDIAVALGNMPYRVAAPIIAEMQRQIEAQKPQPPQQPSGNGQGLSHDRSVG